MGCLRLVGSLKLQVSFAKEPYKRDYILQPHVHLTFLGIPGREVDVRCATFYICVCIYANIQIDI